MSKVTCLNSNILVIIALPSIFCLSCLVAIWVSSGVACSGSDPCGEEDLAFFFEFSFGCGVAGLCLAMKRVALGRFCGGAISSWSFMLICGGRDLQLILVVGLGC